MRNRQRGAYSFLFLIVLIAGGLLVFALAADGARLYAQQRILQQQADAAALGAAQYTQACGSLGVPQESVEQKANEAAARAGYTGTLSGDNVLLGVMESVDQRLRFVPVADIERSNAVYVELTEERPRSLLLPGRLAGTTTLRATAAAKKELIATLSPSGNTAIVGGSVDNNNILGALLGGLLNPGSEEPFLLNPTDLRSLASTLVSVGELLDVLGLDNVEQLPLVSGRALAEALALIGSGLSPVADIVDGVLEAGGIDTLKVSDLISIVGGSAVPPEANFPLYDLLMALVLNVVGDAVFELPDTNVSLALPAGIASVNIDLALSVRAPPRLGMGPARQDAAGEWVTSFSAPDIELGIKVNVRLVGGGIFPALIDLNLPLLVRTGQAEGFLDAANCATGMSNRIELRTQVFTSVANIWTAEVGDSSPGQVELAIGALLRVPVGLELNLAGRPDEVTFNAELVGGRAEARGPETGYFDPQYYGGGVSQADLRLRFGDPVLIDFLPLPIGGILNLLTTVVLAPVELLLSRILEYVVSPLLSLVGVSLGKGSVTLTDAVQTRPQLIHGVEVLEEP